MTWTIATSETPTYPQTWVCGGNNCLLSRAFCWRVGGKMFVEVGAGCDKPARANQNAQHSIREPRNGWLCESVDTVERSVMVMIPWFRLTR